MRYDVQAVLTHPVDSLESMCKRLTSEASIQPENTPEKVPMSQTKTFKNHLRTIKTLKKHPKTSKSHPFPLQKSSEHAASAFGSIAPTRHATRLAPPTPNCSGAMEWGVISAVALPEPPTSGVVLGVQMMVFWYFTNNTRTGGVLVLLLYAFVLQPQWALVFFLFLWGEGRLGF